MWVSLRGLGGRRGGAMQSTLDSAESGTEVVRRVPIESGSLTGIQVEDSESLFQVLGLAAYDLGQVIRHPGFQYWPRVIKDSVTLLKFTAPLAGFMTFFLGGAISIHAITAIRGLGTARELAGIILSSLALRSVSLIMIFMALAASVGTGTVTEFGAMRVSDEVDALESISINSHSYLVGTRMLTVLLVTPILTIFGVTTGFIGGWLIALLYPNLDAGTFGEFFWRGIVPLDFVYVVIEMVVIALIMVIICASQGYRATGGSVGVGLAVGRAMDLVIGVSMMLNLVFSYFFWGTTDTVKF